MSSSQHKGAARLAQPQHKTPHRRTTDEQGAKVNAAIELIVKRAPRASSCARRSGCASVLRASLYAQVDQGVARVSCLTSTW